MQINYSLIISKLEENVEDIKKALQRKSTPHLQRQLEKNKRMLEHWREKQQISQSISQLNKIHE